MSALSEPCAMKGMLVMQKNNKYRSKFDEKEYPVGFSENTGYFALRRNGADVGLLQTADSDARFVKREAAFLFGDTPGELYFRFAYDTLMEIVDDGNDPAAREMLYRAKSGTFWSVAGQETDIPVYHNSSDIIAKLKASHTDENMSDSYTLNPFATPGSAARMEKEVEAFYKKTHALDIEIEEAVNSELEKRNAKVLTVCRFGDNRLFPYFVAQLNNLCLVIVGAHLSGDWLANENDFGDEGPLWFSDSDHHVQSPVSQARRIKDYLSANMPSELDFGAIVVCPHNMTILNYEDEVINWSKIDVKVAWTKPRSAEVGTLYDILNTYNYRISGEAVPADYKLAQSLAAAFNMISENHHL